LAATGIPNDPFVSRAAAALKDAQLYHIDAIDLQEISV
jgi:hypothetical protein